MDVTPHRSVLRALTAVGLASLLLLSTVVLSSPAQAQKIRADFFGMHDRAVSTGTLPGVPIGAVRLWDSGTSWRQIETAPGVFDFDALDKAVDTARTAHVRPTIVLGQTPAFHAQHPGAPGAYGPGATSMPKLPAWKRYVVKVANRYKNTVDYQVWNEPNVVNYWTGSVGQMAKLTATASNKIKHAAGRKATVIAPSFPLRLRGQRRWYHKFWSAKVGRKSVARYVKVVAVNPYPAANKPPEASMKLLRFAKRGLPKAARRKPMWNTEINYGLLGGGTARDIPDAVQAAFVARTMALNAAGPIRRMYWYAWGVGPIANTHLVEDDHNTLTPAGQAWNVARSWLVGTNVKKCGKKSRGKLKGLYTCTARKGRREVRRIYWKPSGKAVRIKTSKTTKRWSDLAGDTTRHRGRFRIKVGQAPIMVASRH